MRTLGDAVSVLAGTDGMRMMTAEEERRLTLLEQQVGSLLAQRERLMARILRLREFIAARGNHTLDCMDCHVCRFLMEDAK